MEFKHIKLCLKHNYDQNSSPNCNHKIIENPSFSDTELINRVAKNIMDKHIRAFSELADT